MNAFPRKKGRAEIQKMNFQANEGKLPGGRNSLHVDFLAERSLAKTD